jgi:hypothetical protein
MRYPKLEHRLVDHIPEAVDPGVLYVCMNYATAAHQCCCGCGNEVITPITPTDWSLIFDGESFSLSPSIGSWTLPCRSHYFIDRGRVIEAPPWSERQVAAERARDRRAKADYYAPPAQAPNLVTRPAEPAPKRASVWQTVRRWLTGW